MTVIIAKSKPKVNTQTLLKLFDINSGDMVNNSTMAEKRIKDLQDEEKIIIVEREKHKKEIRFLTKKLYNIRQKIKYAKNTEQKKPSGALYTMFGKRKSELTPDELREYNKTMQSKRRKKC